MQIMDIAERIKKARERVGLTQVDLALAVGVKQQSIQKIEAGKTKQPRNLEQLAKVLQVRAAWLLSGEAPMSYDDMEDDSGEYYAESAYSGSAAHPSMRIIPVINHVQAGYAREVVDDYAAGTGFDELALDPATAKRLSDSAFALVVKGDSMLPDFREEDQVIVDPAVEAKPGNIVVAKIECDNSATLKKYRSRGSDTNGYPVFDLVPLNEDYPTLRVDSDNPGAIVGVVVEHRRKFI